MQNRIRAVAVAAIVRPGTEQFLVFAGKDDARGLVYNRPFGGGIEFGETAAETIQREIMEEIGHEVMPGQLLGAAEAMFTSGGQPRHEIVVVVEATFCDESLYRIDFFEDKEGNGENGLWRTISSPTILFPEAFPAILRRAGLVR